MPEPESGSTDVALAGQYVLELDNIEMSFGSNQVLKGVTLGLERGKVTALLGANGAGKSTLIKILAGVYFGNTGSIRVEGEEIKIVSPLTAAAQGIQTVHQRIDESIVPGLTVAENLVFEEIVQNQLPLVSSLRALLPRAREIAATLDLNWDDKILRADVFNMGIANCQLLLLARALIHEPKVLVLDEPTSTLSESEVRRLFDVIAALRAKGVAILYVSHHLSEINELADRLVVLRDGRIHYDKARPFEMNEAVQSMLGERVIKEMYRPEIRRGTAACLQLRGVRTLKRSQPFDLTIRYGEVTGIVGLIGSGKSELLRGIYGADRLQAGTLELDGRPFNPRRPADAVAKGVFFVAEDRAAEAMLPKWNLARTATLPFLAQMGGGGVLRSRLETERGQAVIRDFGVISTGPNQAMDALSGGNQQKVVVGRWLEEKPKLMLLDEPFRGVDIGARHDISERVGQLATDGAAVIVATSDVDEVLEVADRIIVMVDGHIRLDDYATNLDQATIVAAISEVE